MSRFRLFAGIALLTAVVSVSGMAPVAQSQDGSRRETIRFHSPDRKETIVDIDLNDDGDTDDAGDGELGYGPVFTRGEKTGSQRHECRTFKATPKAFMLRCVGTFNVTGRGSIEVGGVFRFTRRGIQGAGLAVTGGAGEFRDAGGTMVLDADNNSTDFEFRLIHH